MIVIILLINEFGQMNSEQSLLQLIARLRRILDDDARKLSLQIEQPGEDPIPIPDTNSIVPNKNEISTLVRFLEELKVIQNSMIDQVNSKRDDFQNSILFRVQFIKNSFCLLY